MKAFASTFFMLCTAVGDVLAHGHARSMHPREIASRQLAANRRHVVARNCASQIAEYQQKRKLARRALREKRALTVTSSALEPHETSIRNTTCVTAPEVTEGPYYINNDLIRQDLRETQGGILLELDIGVIDTSTCQPLPDALVEIWHCNATGQYSGFTTAGGTGGGGGGEQGATMGLDPNASAGGPPSDATPSGDGTGAAPTGGAPGGDGQGGAPTSSMTDTLNFLRGGWPTNENGIVTFNSIYPGFYTGRTIHIHTMVHTNITYNSNGTYTSRSGSLVHIGQMFFDEELSNSVMALEPYSTTNQVRSYNADDSILAQENSAGYNAFVDASLIGSDISEGVLGFITVGVDSTAQYEVSSYNYYAEGDLYESVTPDSTDDVITTSGTGTGTGVVTGTAAAANLSQSSSAAVGKFSKLKVWRALLGV